MSTMTPREIVHELDKHIIGQEDAKRSVAIALRNRWRRMQLDTDMRQEITPKNILMIGPTGVGKTEVARRLAKLAKAPFIKVEATKFTEVGYVGRDVESVIRDLVDASLKMVREEQIEKVKTRAEDAAEERRHPDRAPDVAADPEGRAARRDQGRRFTTLFHSAQNAALDPKSARILAHLVPDTDGLARIMLPQHLDLAARRLDPAQRRRIGTRLHHVATLINPAKKARITADLGAALHRLHLT